MTAASTCSERALPEDVRGLPTCAAFRGAKVPISIKRAQACIEIDRTEGIRGRGLDVPSVR